MTKHYELSLVIQLLCQIKMQVTEALLSSANQKGEKLARSAVNGVLIQVKMYGESFGTNSRLPSSPSAAMH